jgi:hypothetical protein
MRRHSGETCTTTNSTSVASGNEKTRTILRCLLGPVRASQSRERRNRSTRTAAAWLGRGAELGVRAAAALERVPTLRAMLGDWEDWGTAGTTTGGLGTATGSCGTGTGGTGT